MDWGGSDVDSQTSQFLLIILPGTIWGIDLTQGNRIGSGLAENIFLGAPAAIFSFDIEKKSWVTFPPEAHWDLCDVYLGTRASFYDLVAEKRVAKRECKLDVTAKESGENINKHKGNVGG